MLLVPLLGFTLKALGLAPRAAEAFFSRVWVVSESRGGVMGWLAARLEKMEGEGLV